LKNSEHQSKTDSQAVLNTNASQSIQGNYAQSLYKNTKWFVLIYSIIAAVYIASIPRTWIWFNWHPLSMIAAFILFASFAALRKKIGGYENTKLHGKLTPFYFSMIFQ
jgi:hypothetical protein